MTSRPLVIYHGGCRDGFCAAWAVRQKLPAAEFVPAYYSQPPPNVTGLDVVMVDFCYSLLDMQRMAAQAASMLVLDHHKTAQEGLAAFKPGNAMVVFDMNRSGAGLAWDYFCGGARPMIVDYVEDRDLWRHVLPHSKAINAYLSTLAFEFDAWTAAQAEAQQDLISGQDATITARMRGTAVLGKMEQYVREVAKNARRVRFEGYDVPIVNAPQCDISEVLHALVQGGGPFAIGWWQRADGLFQYSLRSLGDIDVSVLAKRYGGGGHPNAAGFEQKTLLL